MTALVAAFLASPARAEAAPCNSSTCNTDVCSKACTHPQTGEPTTCGAYYNWNCTPECIRGEPTHYTFVGFFQREANSNGGITDCDLFSEWKEHYTDSCGNSFYKCVFFYERPSICQEIIPWGPQCTGGR